MNKLWLAPVPLILALAPAAAAGGVRNDVFVHPARYLDREVRVCGYMIDSSNVLESRRRREWTRTSGLSIRRGGPLRLLFRGRACVAGVISYLGCETSRTIVCVDTAFDYAIDIRRVISLRPGPDHAIE